ncbi:MAG: hypothetical protein EP330_05295 [Deltaproteobacteria bacterium]|nr:MAG: hypothetical protein EP330_05295 [Deltaproteobacteria bacterium]
MGAEDPAPTESPTELQADSASVPSAEEAPAPEDAEDEAAAVGEAVEDEPAPVAFPSTPPGFEPLPSPAESLARQRGRLVALEDLRFMRTQRAATGQLIAAGVELGVGALAIAGSDPDAGLQAGFGTALVVGGAVHGLQAWAQIDLSHRRHATFGRKLVEIDGQPMETLLLLGDDHALQLERAARGHSFATGLNVGLLGAGLLTAFFAPDQQGQDLGVGMAFVGASGAVHHAVRWRSSVRLGTDLRVLRRQVP